LELLDFNTQQIAGHVTATPLVNFFQQSCWDFAFGKAKEQWWQRLQASVSTKGRPFVHLLNSYDALFLL